MKSKCGWHILWSIDVFFLILLHFKLVFQWMSVVRGCFYHHKSCGAFNRQIKLERVNFLPNPPNVYNLPGPNDNNENQNFLPCKRKSTIKYNKPRNYLIDLFHFILNSHTHTHTPTNTKPYLCFAFALVRYLQQLLTFPLYSSQDTTFTTCGTSHIILNNLNLLYFNLRRYLSHSTIQIKLNLSNFT